jgi:hypothetical protein
MQTLADRFLVGYPYGGEWHMPNVQLVSVYVDQLEREDAACAGETEPTADLSRARAQQFGFRLCSNIPEALRCGGDRIAVDAVLAIVVQDDYPTNDRGQILLPFPRFEDFSMSAFATVERRRRGELLAIQKQDRVQQQAQTTDEPVVVEPSPEQQDPPPHPFIELAQEIPVDRQSGRNSKMGLCPGWRRFDRKLKIALYPAR